MCIFPHDANILLVKRHFKFCITNIKYLRYHVKKMEGGWLNLLLETRVFLFFKRNYLSFDRLFFEIISLKRHVTTRSTKVRRKIGSHHLKTE